MHLDDFPKLQPTTGARMPNKANLKRSLLPENSPLVLQPDLNISHPDKQGLKRIPHASPRKGKIPRIPTMPTRTWHRWTAGLAAALLGTLIWFAGPSPDPMSPGHPPSPEPNPSTNAEVHRNTLQTAIPEHPEADASLAGIPTPSEKNINAIAKSSADTRIETHASDASSLKRPNLLAQLPAPTRKYALLCSRMIQDVLLMRVPPPAPPSLGSFGPLNHVSSLKSSRDRGGLQGRLDSSGS